MLVASTCQWCQSTFLSVILVFLYVTTGSFALHNVTVDDNDSAISYAGTWATSTATPLNVGGTHHYSTDPLATAVFTFTGVAVYYMAPKWAYKVGAVISLNGGEDTFIDLDDTNSNDTSGHEVDSSIIRWSRTGLDGGEQHVVIKFPIAQADFVVVDAFIVTVQDPSDTATSISPANTATNSSQTSTPPSTQSDPSSKKPDDDSTKPSQATSHSNLGPILGSLLGAVTLILIVVCVFYIRRKKKGNDSRHFYPPSQAREGRDGGYPVSFTGASMGSGGGGGADMGTYGGERASEYIIEPLSIPSQYAGTQASTNQTTALGSGMADAGGSTSRQYGAGPVTMEYRPGIGQTILTRSLPQDPPSPIASSSRNAASGSSGPVAREGPGWGGKSDGNADLRTNRDTSPDDPPMYTI